MVSVHLNRLKVALTYLVGGPLNILTGYIIFQRGREIEREMRERERDRERDRERKRKREREREREERERERDLSTLSNILYNSQVIDSRTYTNSLKMGCIPLHLIHSLLNILLIVSSR